MKMNDMMTREILMSRLALRITNGVLLAGLLLLSGIALAQQGTIKLEHKAEQWQSIIGEDGAEQVQLVEATNVVPGEKVLFTVTYANTGDQPAENVTITNPVPEHMVYVDDSAAGDNTSILFSADGGENFAAASDLRVSNDDGSQRPASASDYTHVRWVVQSDIAPGTSGAVQFAAVVK
jgi:uncharacterized repeat protein (TIGR01451 family)